MFDNLDIFRMAGGLARHAASRQEIVAKNIANADTPEYRAQDVTSFEKAYQADQKGEGLKATRPGHVFEGETSSLSLKSVDVAGPSSPNGNTVSLETEMMKSVETRHQHDLAMSVYKSSLNILRTSIGRR